jgi:hypothetical protein
MESKSNLSTLFFKAVNFGFFKVSEFKTSLFELIFTFAGKVTVITAVLVRKKLTASLRQKNKAKPQRIITATKR